jgi:hypothetical protein
MSVAQVFILKNIEEDHEVPIRSAMLIQSSTFRSRDNNSIKKFDNKNGRGGLRLI